MSSSANGLKSKSTICANYQFTVELYDMEGCCHGINSGISMYFSVGLKVYLIRYSCFHLLPQLE